MGKPIRRWSTLSACAARLTLHCLSIVLIGLALANAPACAAQERPSTIVIEARPGGVDEDELNCLAEAVYFEARGEGSHGQRAVAEVILNRRASPSFPDTVCDVVHQGYNPVSPRLHKCQFSYYCDGLPEAFGDRDRLARIRAMAWNMLRGMKSNLTMGATYYHADYVSPGWARNLLRVARVDQHIFYREP